MPDCCMCAREAVATTALIDGESFAICRVHLELWQRTPENISLREWCRRITSVATEINGKQIRLVGKSVLCDWIDSMAVCS